MPGAVPRGDDGGEGARRRDRWLTRGQVLACPWFLAACAGLRINDHVLKARYPGLVTGKASDVAGVVVVAALASVLLGRRLAVVSTAVAFTALKTAPGVAEAVAPVLGGVSRRDATDVLAVLALAPMWRVGRRLPRAARAPGEPGANASVRPWGRPGRVVLCVLGAGASLFTITATSAVQEDAVVEVLADGPVVFARVASGYGGEGYWARSDDGGHSWARGTEPAGPPRPFDSAIVTRSNGAASAAGPSPRATAAFSSRAPSR